jgi:hypothetical protein
LVHLLLIAAENRDRIVIERVGWPSLGWIGGGKNGLAFHIGRTLNARRYRRCVGADPSTRIM